MLASALFFFLRLVEIVTLIPAWGMLAYFVHKYDDANVTPPASILVLFIVAILATAWAFLTLIQSKRFGAFTLLTAIVDMLLFGALIAGVYYLRGVRYTDCSSVSVPVLVTWGDRTFGGTRWSIDVDKHCSMLKASWAFGIINIVLFFLTSLLALYIYGKGDAEKERRGSHSSGRRRRRYW